jgi:hypothetical protein
MGITTAKLVKGHPVVKGVVTLGWSLIVGQFLYAAARMADQQSNLVVAQINSPVLKGLSAL